MTILLGASGIYSDDFYDGNPRSLWTVLNPGANGQGVRTFLTPGTINSRCALSIDATDHSLDSGSNRGLSMTQPVSVDGAFVLQTKIDSRNADPGSEQGIWIDNGAGVFYNYTVYHDQGGDWRMVAGLPLTPQYLNDIPIGGTYTAAPIWLRVTRTGTSWTSSWSTTGNDPFTLHVAATVSMTVANVGIYVANYDKSGFSAHSAEFDYFFENSAPITLEDQGVAPSTRRVMVIT